jgi:hypothetical protein
MKFLTNEELFKLLNIEHLVKNATAVAIESTPDDVPRIYIEYLIEPPEEDSFLSLMNSGISHLKLMRIVNGNRNS